MDHRGYEMALREADARLTAVVARLSTENAVLRAQLAEAQAEIAEARARLRECRSFVEPVVQRNEAAGITDSIQHDFLARLDAALGKGGGVTPDNPFSPEKLKAQVDLALAAIPPEKTRALVAYADTHGDWHLAYAHRLNGEWVLGASVGRTLPRGVEGQVVVQWSR